MSDIISLVDKNGQSQLYQVEAIDIVDASTGEMPVLAEDSQFILITFDPYNSLDSRIDSRRGPCSENQNGTNNYMSNDIKGDMNNDIKDDIKGKNHERYVITAKLL